MTKHSLQSLRQDIDVLDREIVALLEKRLQLVSQLKLFKPTLDDPEREKQILAKIDSVQIKHIYLAIFEASKQHLNLLGPSA